MRVDAPVRSRGSGDETGTNFPPLRARLIDPLRDR